MFIKEIRLNNPIDPASYLSKIPAVRYLIDNRSITLNSDVTIFVGENGSGKSTLLEAIAVAYGFNPEGGTKNFSFSTKNSHSDLYKNLTLTKVGYPKDGFFLRAESFYNVATNIDALSSPGLGIPIIESYGGISLHDQSHGESFLSVVQNRFGGNGIYILDEPEAALSPMRLLTLISEIKQLEKSNSQFIIATHSPILMSYPGADIKLLSENGIESVDYRQTEHYIITKRMLDDPDGIYRYLFDEE